MKNTVKQLAVVTFIALILLAGNVKAEGTELLASGHEMTEASLQLENWMTDESTWNTNTFFAADFALEAETALELESWMLGESVWSSDMPLVTEIEADVELESWMTSADNWNVQTSVVEEKLVIEDWMTDSKVWK